MGEEEFQIKYEPTEDVMYISIGSPKPGIAVEQSDGVFMRLDPDTGSLVGFTIVGFRELFQRHPGKLLVLPFASRKAA